MFFLYYFAVFLTGQLSSLPCSLTGLHRRRAAERRRRSSLIRRLASSWAASPPGSSRRGSHPSRGLAGGTSPTLRHYILQRGTKRVVIMEITLAVNIAVIKRHNRPNYLPHPSFLTYYGSLIPPPTHQPPPPPYFLQHSLHYFQICSSPPPLSSPFSCRSLQLSAPVSFFRCRAPYRHLEILLFFARAFFFFNNETEAESIPFSDSRC